MKEFIKNTIFKLLIAAVMITILLTEGVTYAWLSTSWNGGNFELTTAETNIPELEVWAFDSDNDWQVIYPTESDDDANTKEKKIAQINDEGYYDTDDEGNYTTDNDGNKIVTTKFTPIEDDDATDDDDAIPLYFGTIRNLVEKQDNAPVYLRLKVTLPARSSNDIVVKCVLDGIRAYQIKDLSNNNTTGEYVSEDTITVNNKETTFSDYLMDQDFLNLEYVQTDTEYNLTTDTTTNITSVPDALEALFGDDANPAPYEYSNIKGESGGATEATITVENSDTKKNDEGKVATDAYGDPEYIEKITYVYFKFSIETDALRSSIDEMQTFMPLYLIFDVDFDIEIRNTYLS